MKVERICVFGSSFMGRQIAQHAAVCGYEVSFVGIRGDARIIQEGFDFIRDNLQRFYVNKNRMTPSQMEALLRRIKCFTNLGDAVKGAQVVIENILEDLRLKQRKFKELDELCAPEPILASDSSSAPRLGLTVFDGLTLTSQRVKGVLSPTQAISSR